MSFWCFKLTKKISRKILRKNVVPVFENSVEWALSQVLTFMRLDKFQAKKKGGGARSVIAK
jgi:hypothetical protein